MATALHNTDVDQNDKFLVCLLCQKTLNDARTLDCFHSFCKRCLEAYVKTERGKTAEMKVESFACPVCKTEFCLKPEESVDKIPPNELVTKMLEDLAIKCQTKEQPCVFCGAQSPAVCRCTTCERYLCTKCLSVHNNWPDFSEHVVLTMEDLAKPENQVKARGRSRCKSHDGKPHGFYCETCKEFVCLYCTEGKHAKPGHSYVPLTEFIAKLKDALNTSSAVLAQQLSERNKLLQEIEYTTQRLENNAKKAKDSITQDKQNIRKQAEEVFKLSLQRLEEKANHMIDEVDKKHKEVREALAKQRAEIKTDTEKIKGSADLAKKLIANGSVEELHFLQKKIDENVKSIQKKWPCDTAGIKPVHDGHVEYKVNTTTTDTTQYASIENILGEVACYPAAITTCEFCNASAILNGDSEYCNQLRQWLGNQIQWHLCYRATRDGWSAQNFHEKCDYKGPTLTLVQVNNSIFGGCTDQSWTSGAGSYKQSNSSFLFSLQNNYAVPTFKANVYQNPQNATYCNINYGPTFGGGHDLYLANNANTNQNSYSNLGNTYQPPTGYTYGSEQTQSFLAGSYKFTPTEVEVFY